MPGALFNLGHDIARSTIAANFQRHGTNAAPERSRKMMKEFLMQHWYLIVAADFFTIEAWTRVGLERFIILFFIELSRRKVEIAGIASNVNGLWMGRIGRNLTDPIDGVLKGKVSDPRSRSDVHDRVPEHTRRNRRGVG